jgi:hypothetical protein
LKTGQRILAGTLAVAVAVTLASCTQEPTSPAAGPTSTSPTLIATGAIPVVPNDLATNSAHHSLEVPGEQFALTVDYWTDYDAPNWQTLQPKKINLSVHLAPTASATGEAPEVVIGSFAGVTTLLAAMPGLDGLPIAETTQQPNAIAGYLINANYPYDNVLTIEGFSAPLVDRWQVVAGDEALTEPGLVAAGVYANRITFTYRILVRNNGDAGYHQRILQDTLTVTEAPAAAPAPAGSTATVPSG